MCLSTVYPRSGSAQKEIMKDVARIEAEAQGFRMIDLFGNKMFVQGAIKIIDLADGHSVVIEKESDHGKKIEPTAQDQRIHRLQPFQVAAGG